MTKEFTDKNFKDEVLEAEGPVLVDFWAAWCGPCKMLAPVIDKLAEDFDGKGVKIGKLNVDENKETASEYGISGIPTILIFKDGKPVEKMVGVQPIDAFKSMINNHLN